MPRLSSPEYCGLDELFCRADTPLDQTLVLPAQRSEINSPDAMLYQILDEVRSDVRSCLNAGYDAVLDDGFHACFAPYIEQLGRELDEATGIGAETALYSVLFAVDDEAAGILTDKLISGQDTNYSRTLAELDKMSLTKNTADKILEKIKAELPGAYKEEDTTKLNTILAVAKSTIGEITVEPVYKQPTPAALPAVKPEIDLKIAVKAKPSVGRFTKATAAILAMSMLANSALPPKTGTAGPTAGLASLIPESGRANLILQPNMTQKTIEKLLQDLTGNSSQATAARNLLSKVIVPGPDQNPVNAAQHVEQLTKVITGGKQALQPQTGVSEALVAAAAQAINNRKKDVTPERLKLASAQADLLKAIVTQPATVGPAIAGALAGAPDQNTPNGFFVAQLSQRTKQNLGQPLAEQLTPEAANAAAVVFGALQASLMPTPDAMNSELKNLNLAPIPQPIIDTQAKTESPVDPAAPPLANAKPSSPEPAPRNINDITSLKIENYDGVLPLAELQRIKENLPVYLQVAKEKDIPWIMLAVIHNREHRNIVDNPPKGQGMYQFVDKHGGPYPEGPVTRDEFIRQTRLAADFLKAKAAAFNQPDLKQLTASASPDVIKDTFFSYNGRAPVYYEQARRLGFTRGADGSPYVMNLADDLRNPLKNPRGWGQIKADHGPIVFPANKDAGAFVLYRELSALAGFPLPAESMPKPAPSQPESATNPVADKIVAIAQAEYKKRVVESPLNCDAGNTSSSGSCGAEVDKYTDNHLEYWCADFASWVLKQSGAGLTGGLSGGWRYPSVQAMTNWFRANATYIGKGQAPPKPGDMIFYGNSHMGIVTAVEGDLITTVAGNAAIDNRSNNGNGVAQSRFNYMSNGSGVTGFGRMTAAAVAKVAAAVPAQPTAAPPQPAPQPSEQPGGPDKKASKTDTVSAPTAPPSAPSQTKDESKNQQSVSQPPTDRSSNGSQASNNDGKAAKSDKNKQPVTNGNPFIDVIAKIFN